MIIGCRMSTKYWLAIGMLLAASGCSKSVKTGERFEYPKDKACLVFAVSNITQSVMTSRKGYLINGVDLNQASLLRNSEELSRSTRIHYAIFPDSFLGIGVQGRYWQQQSKRQEGLGLPVMDTRASKITVVTINSSKKIVDVKIMRAAHARIAVDTNDFSRPFTP
jgi:hypothetical protein